MGRARIPRREHVTSLKTVHNRAPSRKKFTEAEEGCEREKINSSRKRKILTKGLEKEQDFQGQR